MGYGRAWDLLRSRYLRLGLSLAASALLIYLAFHSVDLGQVWSALVRARLGWLLASALCVFLYTLLKILRWHILLGAARAKVRPVDTAAAFLAGQLVDLVTPGHVGELGRSYLLGSRGPGGFFVLGTVVLEKTLDFFWYALLIGLTLLLVPLPPWFRAPAVFFVAAAVFLTTAVLFAVYRPAPLHRFVGWAGRFLPGRFREYLLSRFDRLLESLEIVQRTASMLWVSLLSAAIWGSAVLVNALVLRAVDLHLALSAPLLLLVAIQAGVSTINTPGQIGVFEYIGVLTLGLYGVAPAPALGYSLLLHLISILPIVLGGGLSIWYLGLSGRKASTGQALAPDHVK